MARFNFLETVFRNMRKRRKKIIATAIDDEGYLLNCYGNKILWTKDLEKRAMRKAHRWEKEINQRGYWL